MSDSGGNFMSDKFEKILPEAECRICSIIIMPINTKAMDRQKHASNL